MINSFSCLMAGDAKLPLRPSFELAHSRFTTNKQSYPYVFYLYKKFPLSIIYVHISFYRAVICPFGFYVDCALRKSRVQKKIDSLYSWLFCSRAIYNIATVRCPVTLGKFMHHRNRNFASLAFFLVSKHRHLTNY